MATRQFQLTGRSWLLLIAVIMLLVEGALRLPAIEALLPQPNPYYLGDVETRRRRLERLMAEEGSVDVLFIGSSATMMGVQPLLFDEQWSAATAEPLISFNAALPGLSPSPTAVYLKRFWLPRARPQVVVQGVRFIELLHDRPPEANGDFTAGAYEQAWLGLTSVPTLRLWLLDHVRLAYYSGFLADTLATISWPPNAEKGFPVDSRGYNATGETRQLLSDVRRQYPDERIPGYEELSFYNKAITAADLAPGLAALEAAIDIAQANGSGYILANVPELGEKFAETPAAGHNYALYLAELAALARRRQVRFIDVTQGDPDRFGAEANFSDFQHLSPTGSTRFTVAMARQLAEEDPRLVNR